ncbi:hypothetical protein HMPREF1544_12029 [Mucor circinelloides 1006PhL]|uniref:Chromatin structure-remodeling complex subunit SFH1 n=1 Tax=Mucor circinelloides f. circinelloides (strain 1006PhL) TaxID=1220926 RepID=S2JFG6_MUCC1|nr:hypothetical protein HMPREF1544_12029 [Mucor circinelloides 1006PhL]
MQNSQIPPHLMQQQQPQPQRVFHPQVAYPLMSNIMPSERTQGVFSTYPARLKHSDDNALLLPESYVPKKTRFRGNESEDEFDQMMEESDDDEDEDRMDDDHAAAGTNKKSASTNEADSNMNTLPGIAAPPPPADWPRVIRQKNDMTYSLSDLSKISETEENLVPIRLDIDIDSVKLRDRFLWNLNEQCLTPDKFAIMLCQDLDLPILKFLQPIADSIRAQIIDFESYSQAGLPSQHTRVIINLDLQVGKVNYRDQFEWELQNEKTNAPEVFSRQLASELGVGGEYVAIISHAIREQLLLHKKQYFMMDGEIRTHLDNGFRPIEEAKQWVPRMDMLSNDELEKLLVAQERNIRRMRRETRFKRQTRGRQ